MKKFFTIIRALAIVVLSAIVIGCSCTKPGDQTINYETQSVKLSKFAGTRVSEPLENTIWEYITGDKYNKYIMFKDGEASVFYGYVEDGELQRWSDFYSNPYEYSDEGLKTSVSYPQWGETICTENISVIEFDDIYTIDVNGESYKYLTNNTDSVEGMWMLITVTIVPWQMEQ